MKRAARDFALEVLGDLWSLIGRKLREWKRG